MRQLQLSSMSLATQRGNKKQEIEFGICFMLPVIISIELYYFWDPWALLMLSSLILTAYMYVSVLREWANLASAYHLGV